MSASATVGANGLEFGSAGYPALYADTQMRSARFHGPGPGITTLYQPAWVGRQALRGLLSAISSHTLGLFVATGANPRP